MDVSLDGGNDHGSPFAACASLFLGVHERLQIGDCTLHDSCAFHYLRKEHFTVSKQIAHNLHAIHERSLDDLKGATELLSGLFGVFLDVIADAFNQGVGKTFRYG